MFIEYKMYAKGSEPRALVALVRDLASFPVSVIKWQELEKLVTW